MKPTLGLNVLHNLIDLSLGFHFLMADYRIVSTETDLSGFSETSFEIGLRSLLILLFISLEDRNKQNFAHRSSLSVTKTMWKPVLCGKHDT